MDDLIYLLKLTEENLKIYLGCRLLKMGMNPVCNDGFIYAEGIIPVLVVAHMDTVFEEPPLIVLKKYGMLYNPLGGLGGDDRCGIYAILKLLEDAQFRPYVLFTEDEEIGGVGAFKAVDKLDIPNVKYIIEFDRRGSNDCVFYGCGNEEFIKYIETFGFKKAEGSFSDISILGSHWNIASVNLSCGYYEEHTNGEFVIFEELLETIKKAKKMLGGLSDAPYFDYQEKCSMAYDIYGLNELYPFFDPLSYFGNDGLFNERGPLK